MTQANSSGKPSDTAHTSAYWSGGNSWHWFGRNAGRPPYTVPKARPGPLRHAESKITGDIVSETRGCKALPYKPASPGGSREMTTGHETDMRNNARRQKRRCDHHYCAVYNARVIGAGCRGGNLAGLDSIFGWAGTRTAHGAEVVKRRGRAPAYTEAPGDQRLVRLGHGKGQHPLDPKEARSMESGHLVPMSYDPGPCLCVAAQAVSVVCHQSVWQTNGAPYGGLTCWQ